MRILVSGSRCWRDCDSFDPGVQRAAMRVCFEHFLNDPQSAPAGEDGVRRSEYLRAEDSHGRGGNPQFLKRRLGVAGGAVSQDQDYLDRTAAAFEAQRALEYPIVVDTVLAQPAESRTPT